MRLTRETLIKIARDTAAQRARVSRRIICIYLTGSVLSEAPLLGGTTDIDLVIIQDSEPVQPREIIRLSDEVHLDIGYYSQATFHHPRHLRTDPWLGPAIYSKPLVLFDTQHWFDFIQAATGAQFFQPDYALQRASALAQEARQGWLNLELNREAAHANRVYQLFKVLENAGNALVSLTGESMPLAERRFLLQLPARLQSLNQPELTSGLIKLLFPNPAEMEEVWPNWLADWNKAFHSACVLETPSLPIHAARLPYYERAASAIWNDNPDAAAWVLLRTWALAAGSLPLDDPSQVGWQSACRFLGLDEENFPARIEMADQYLDRVEEALDTWGRANGVSNDANI